MIFSSNFLKRWSFQKEPRQHMIFSVIWKDGIFSQKHDLFPLAGQVKDGPSQEINGNMMHRPAKKNRKPDI